ncbi:hypothetical protein LQ327_30440 [Actinomycetospora endophytica]|uniref:Uncharacterized protein n=1 Tax=Actinomycetospora endophytica TaxID=2291215 RepID=A0ABS8PI35_9PSEU|nr:hypothetical protein [Actinomycetospora endophytica]MCD2197698.1 hypothetical protein [Actinomycetospora endophytica]
MYVRPDELDGDADTVRIPRQHLDIARQSPSSPPRQWSSAKTAAITAVITLILSVGTGYGLELLKLIEPPGQVVDSFAAQPFSVSTTPAGLYGGGLYGTKGEFAFKEPLNLTPEERAFFASQDAYPMTPDGAVGDPVAEQRSSRYFNIAAKYHGISIGEVETLATLRGLSNETVHLSNMRVKFVERDATWNGGVFCEDNQGGGPVDAVAFDLDSSDPVAQVADIGGAPTGQPLFSAKQYTLQHDELLTFDLHFRTKLHHAKFIVDVDWDTPSNHGTYEVSDQGTPFEVTGPATPNSFDPDANTAQRPLTGYRTAWAIAPTGPYSQVTPGVGGSGC